MVTAAAAIAFGLTVLTAVALAAGPATPPPSAPAGTPSVPDTEFTPVAKDGCANGWSEVAGAVFTGAVPCHGYDASASPVPPTVDFYAVRFHGDRDGYAGGAACADPSTPADDAHLAACPRVPVLYHYSDQAGWQQVSLPGGDKPGFIGAIAYINRDSVLAVGGDGVYPAREPTCSAAETSGCVNDPNYADPAGNARAWLYSGGQWCEIGTSGCGSLGRPVPEAAPTSTDPSATVSVPMRGLTAVDCSPRPREGCMAGGLHQLWRFDPYSESFRSGWGNGSSPQDFVDGASFRYRVREIRFVPGSVTPAVQAIAVTSGCCTIDPTTGQPDPTKDTPRVLLYDGDRWHSTIMGVSSGGCDAEADPNAADSYYALTVTKALYYAGGSQIDYSLLSAPGGSPQALSTPGGVPVPSGPSAPEATSQINTNTVPTNFPPPSNGNASQCFCPKSSNPNSLTGCDITLSYGWATADATAVLRPPLGRVRLVAGDGDHGNFRFMSPRAEMRRVGGAVRSVDGP